MGFSMKCLYKFVVVKITTCGLSLNCVDELFK